MPHPYDTVAVVIPALDEQATLPGVLADLPRVGTVVVVDNGSRDRTAEIARSAGAVVVHEPRRGYGNACRAGIAEARKRGAEVIVILDADHADDPRLLPSIVDPVLAGEADLVTTDRTARAAPGALTIPQRYGNALATWLIYLVTGHRWRDMGPFRAVRLDALERLEMVDPNYGWNVEMHIKAVRRGLRIREIALPYRPRAGGRSKVSGSLSGTVSAGAKILWSVARYAR